MDTNPSGTAVSGYGTGGGGGRVAIVTGASRGLGYELTRRLAADGWRVVLDARDGDALRQAVAGLGPAVTAVPGDVTDAGHRESLVAAARSAGGHATVGIDASIA